MPFLGLLEITTSKLCSMFNSKNHVILLPVLRIFQFQLEKIMKQSRTTFILVHEFQIEKITKQATSYVPLVILVLCGGLIKRFAIHLSTRGLKRSTWNKISHNKSYTSDMAIHSGKMKCRSSTKIVRSSNLVRTSKQTIITRISQTN